MLFRTIVILVAAPLLNAQTGGSVALIDLRDEVRTLERSQNEIQKSLQTIKDILMGKPPQLEDVVVSVAGSPMLTKGSAKLTIVEFGDYQCSFCGRYARETFPRVVEEYIKPGKLRYVFRNFPLDEIHPLAEKAAEAALCADHQGKYWEAHELFFKNQESLQLDQIYKYSTALGLDQSQFKECLESGRDVSTIEHDVTDGQKLGVRGTPGFFFGFPDPKDPSRIDAVKYLNGAPSFRTIKAAIEELLDKPANDRDARTPTQ